MANPNKNQAPAQAHKPGNGSAPTAAHEYLAPTDEGMAKETPIKGTAQPFVIPTVRAAAVTIGKLWANEKMNVRGDSKDNPDAGQKYKDLVGNIRVNGLIEPIVVVEEAGPKGEEYRVIAGYRRFAACKEIGLASVSCVIKDLSKGLGRVNAVGVVEHVAASPRAVELALAASENNIRDDMTAWAQIATVHGYHKEGLGYEDTKSIMGGKLATSTYYNYRKIGSLPPRVIAKLRSSDFGGNKGVVCAHEMIGDKACQGMKANGAPVWSEEACLAFADKWLADKKAEADASRAEKGSGDPGAPAEMKHAYRYSAGDVFARLDALLNLSDDAYLVAAILVGKVTSTEGLEAPDKAIFLALTTDPTPAPDAKPGAAKVAPSAAAK